MPAVVSPIGDLAEVDLPVTAVFLVALRAGRILTVLLDRGWDIPGGHIEAGETVHEALVREVREEAAVVFSSARPFASVRYEPRRDCMLLFVAGAFELRDFVANAEVSQRSLMSVDDFLRAYRGDRDVMPSILELVRSAAEKRSTSLSSL